MHWWILTSEMNLEKNVPEIASKPYATMTEKHNTKKFRLVKEKQLYKGINRVKSEQHQHEVLFKEWSGVESHDFVDCSISIDLFET